LCDFEERAAFIRKRLRGRVQGPVLFSLLGNTLGNVDRYETTFMRQLQRLLEREDYLLLEVAILTPEWRLENDIRYDLSRHNTVTRRFYSQGLSLHTGEGLQSIVNVYEQRINVRAGHSDVPGAVSVDYVDRRTDRLIASLRRYDWNKFLAWLENFDFTVISQPQNLAFEEGGIGIGAVLLKKR
jgi:hypothetical protein